MKKKSEKKSEFQKEIEEQQKRLEELYTKILRLQVDTKNREVPKKYEGLVSC